MIADLGFPAAAEVVAALEDAVRGGSGVAGTAPKAGRSAWGDLIVALARSNLKQWDLEDAARDPRAGDTEVARAKREIDRLNIARHRLVQEIDAAIDARIDQSAAAPLATESPGMVLDRLSVLVIRRTRTADASSRDASLAARVPVLQSQITALSAALDGYIDELRAGTRRFLCYQSLKLYGPSSFAGGSTNE